VVCSTLAREKGRERGEREERERRERERREREREKKGSFSTFHGFSR